MRAIFIPPHNAPKLSPAAAQNTAKYALTRKPPHLYFNPSNAMCYSTQIFLTAVHDERRIPFSRNQYYYVPAGTRIWQIHSIAGSTVPHPKSIFRE